MERKVDFLRDRDEVLRYAVQTLKQEREHYNWVGIYLVEVTRSFCTTTSANQPNTRTSQ
jgi:putative methionine-R-sulfoxide reductase with GAF domain